MKKESCPVYLIMAAGVGRRMNAATPKVLNEVGGRAILLRILDVIAASQPGAVVGIVVGHRKELVEQAVLKDEILKQIAIHFINQKEQLGTGHAVQMAFESSFGAAHLKSAKGVVVLPGDVPLLTPELINELSASLGKSHDLRIVTTRMENPRGYGRIVRRGKSGPLLKIVEDRDASARELEISEVNVSLYHFDSKFLKGAIQKLRTKNAQSEYYLTDVIQDSSRRGGRIDVLFWSECRDLVGVNNQWELSLASRIINRRTLKKHALNGVRFKDVENTWIESGVTIATHVTIEQGVVLKGRTAIGEGSVIGAHCVLNDVEIGSEAVVKVGTVGESSKIGNRASVGPYAHLRPGSVVESEAKIGNFVELKNSRIGQGTSIAHLSYVGDADVGKSVNIGCGFVTCNYDGRTRHGRRKHPTVIEDGCFIGSDCQTVAPVRIEKGAYIASGSTITEDVPADALAVARARQINKPGYAKKLRESLELS